MTNPYFLDVLASERRADLQARAARGRMQAIATCCKPSVIVAAVRGALGRRARTGTTPVACCI